MAKKSEQPKAAAPTKVAKPEADLYLTTIPVSTEIRAGLPNYAREMQERLQDVEEETRKVFYAVTVKLSGKLYKKLLLAALEEAAKNPDWTEQNQLEQLVKNH